MTDLTTDAAWVLTATFALSLAYEAYRATVHAGESEHDPTRAFVSQLPLYVIATAVITVCPSMPSWQSRPTARSTPRGLSPATTASPPATPPPLPRDATAPGPGTRSTGARPASSCPRWAATTTST